MIGKHDKCDVPGPQKNLVYLLVTIRNGQFLVGDRYCRGMLSVHALIPVLGISVLSKDFFFHYIIWKPGVFLSAGAAVTASCHISHNLAVTLCPLPINCLFVFSSAVRAITGEFMGAFPNKVPI